MLGDLVPRKPGRQVMAKAPTVGGGEGNRFDLTVVGEDDDLVVHARAVALPAPRGKPDRAVDMSKYSQRVRVSRAKRMRSLVVGIEARVDRG